MGKVVVILLLAAAVLGGVGIWYTQTRAFWSAYDGPVTLTLAGPEGGLTAIPADGVTAARSTSSPLGFRACFAHGLDLDALDAIPTVAAADPAPTVPPPWFDCFDPGQVAARLDAGTARAFLAYPNVAFGVDRIVALDADGRGWAWHQLNECGRKRYDGTQVGPTCPDRDTYEPLTEGSL